MYSTDKPERFMLNASCTLRQGMSDSDHAVQPVLCAGCSGGTANEAMSAGLANSATADAYQARAQQLHVRPT